jgi:hypothetical protein
MIKEYRIETGSVMIFDSETERDNYFDSHVVAECEWDNMSYARLSGGTIRVQLNADVVNAKNINWIKFKNANFGDKWIYAAITKPADYINKSVSELQYTTDWLTTYWFDLDLTKESYIARRSINSKDDGAFIANLPLEDLNLGTNYLTTGTYTDYNSSDESFGTGQFYYLLLTKALCTEGNSHKIVTNAITLTNTDGKEITISNGESSVLYGYIMNFDCLDSCYSKGLFSEDCDLVNSLMYVVRLPFGRSLFPSGITNIASKISTTSSPDIGQQLPTTAECYEQTNFGYLHESKTIPSSLFSGLAKQINSALGSNSTDAPTSGLGRLLLKYPYTLMQVYDYVNQPVNLHLNELRVTNSGNQYAFINDGLKVHKYGSIGQTPTYSVTIERNGNNTIDDNMAKSIDDGGIGNLQSINFYTVTGSFTLPIINSALASFMQSNANQINAQRSQIVSTYQTQLSNAGATLQNAYNVSSMSYANSVYAASSTYDNAYLNANMNFNNSVINAGLISTATQEVNQANYNNSVAGQIGNMLNKNWVDTTMFQGLTIGTASALDVMTKQSTLNANQGMATANQLATINSANTAQGTSMNTAATNLNIGLMNAETNKDIAIASANTTYGIALRNANTSYANSMRSLNARVQDIGNVPDTVQTMGNYQSIANTMLNRDGITYQVKTLPLNILKRLASYFVYNGVMVSYTDTIDNIKTQFADNSGFYIQTVNANVAGDCPPYALSQIQSQLDTGVYFWKPDYYRNYESMYNI